MKDKQVRGRRTRTVVTRRIGQIAPEFRPMQALEWPKYYIGSKPNSEGKPVQRGHLPLEVRMALDEMGYPAAVIAAESVLADPTGWDAQAWLEKTHGYHFTTHQSAPEDGWDDREPSHGFSYAASWGASQFPLLVGEDIDADIVAKDPYSLMLAIHDHWRTRHFPQPTEGAFCLTCGQPGLHVHSIVVGLGR